MAEPATALSKLTANVRHLLPAESRSAGLIQCTSSRDVNGKARFLDIPNEGDLMNPSPEWIWGIAIVLLGIALAYGIARGKRPKHTQRDADEATKRNFDKQ